MQDGDGSQWRVYIMYGHDAVNEPDLCELALGEGGFGIGGSAEFPVYFAGAGPELATGRQVWVSAPGALYQVTAP